MKKVSIYEKIDGRIVYYHDMRIRIRSGRHALTVFCNNTGWTISKLAFSGQAVDFVYNLSQEWDSVNQLEFYTKSGELAGGIRLR